MQLTKVQEFLVARRWEGNVVNTAILTLLAALLALMPLPLLSFPAAWLLLILLPGLQIVRALGLYATWREGRTLILSAATGLLAAPLFIYWASLLFGFNRLIVFITPALLALGLAWLNDRRPLEPRLAQPLAASRRQYVIFAFLLLLLLICLIIPYIEGHTSAGVYPVEMADWFKHYGVSWSLRHTGVPPADVFFYGDPTRGKLSYYYFFHLTVASLDLLHGGESSLNFSFVILMLTAALSFVLVFYLLARQVLGQGSAALWALLFVTLGGGLDLIPMIPHSLKRFKELFPDTPLTFFAFLSSLDHIDAWTPAPRLRLNPLYVQYLWVPQHVTGLLALFVGLYCFREVHQRSRLMVAAPLILLAVLGHSAWIALIAFICLALYALVDLAKTPQIFAQGTSAADPLASQRRRAALWLLGGYALVALSLFLISLPLLREMTGPDAPKSGLAFEVSLTGSWAPLAPFRTNFGNALWTRLLDLPLHYFFELGAGLVCGLAGLWLFWRRRSEPLLPFFGLSGLVGFLVISSIASGRSWISLGFTLNNDLGMRAIMPAQATLALFAGYFVANLSTLPLARWLKILLGALIGVMMILGVLAVVWEVWAMGGAKYLKPPRLDPATYQALQAMPTVTEPLAVVKHRTHDNASAYQLMFADRSPGFFTVEAAVFHPDLTQVIYQFGLSRFAYLNGLPAWSYQLFQEMYADYIYVGPNDRSADLYPEKFDNPTYYENVYRQGDIAIYKVRDLPLNQQQARFVPAGIEFRGHIVDKSPIYPLGFQTTAPQALVTAWRLEQPIAQDYTVYIHFIDPAGQVVAQADHQLWTWVGEGEGPTSIWEAGRTYLDIIPLPPEVLAASTPLQVGIGLWLPQTGEYQQVEPVDLTLDAGQRLIIGTIEP